jgi:hypothetical protein
MLSVFAEFERAMIVGLGFVSRNAGIDSDTLGHGPRIAQNAVPSTRFFQKQMVSE